MSFRLPDESLSESLYRIYRVLDDSEYPGRYEQGDWTEMLEVVSMLAHLLAHDVGFARSTTPDERHVEYLIPAQVRHLVADAVDELGKTAVTDPTKIAASVIARRFAGLLDRVFMEAIRLEEELPEDRKANGEINSLRSHYDARNAHRQLMRDLRAAAEARRGAEESAAAAERAVVATKQSAGEQGAWRLEQHYGAYARREGVAANTFRAAAIGLFVSVVGIALMTPDGGIEANHLIKRASVGIPLLALSAYLASEANRHRRVAQWARTIQVQLRTFDAFVEPLDQEAATAVRQAFARRVFGEVATSDARGEADAADVLARLTELLRASKPER